jgi:hypothetical protein
MDSNSRQSVRLFAACIEKLRPVPEAFSQLQPMAKQFTEYERNAKRTHRKIPASMAGQITSNFVALNKELNELFAARNAKDIGHAMQRINDTLELLPDPTRLQK